MPKLPPGTAKRQASGRDIQEVRQRDGKTDVVPTCDSPSQSKQTAKEIAIGLDEVRTKVQKQLAEMAVLTGRLLALIGDDDIPF